jgi:hypothetical protein
MHYRMHIYFKYKWIIYLTSKQITYSDDLIIARMFLDHNVIKLENNRKKTKACLNLKNKHNNFKHNINSKMIITKIRELLNWSRKGYVSKQLKQRLEGVCCFKGTYWTKNIVNFMPKSQEKKNKTHSQNIDQSENTVMRS